MTAFNRIEKIVLVSLTVTFIVAGQIILLNADTSAWASSSVSIEKGYHAPYSTLFVPSILNHVEISIPAMIGVIYAVLSMNMRVFRPVAAIGSAAWAWKCYTDLPSKLYVVDLRHGGDAACYGCYDNMLIFSLFLFLFGLIALVFVVGRRFWSGAPINWRKLLIGVGLLPFLCISILAFATA
jgi:hypothetical protein